MNNAPFGLPIRQRFAVEMWGNYKASEPISFDHSAQQPVQSRVFLHLGSGNAVTFWKAN